MERMKARTILTTDLECDDMNSLIHLSLFLNEIDLEGIIYTASQFHFNGDGISTLGEATPHYNCIGEAAFTGHVGYPHPDPAAKDLTRYRPFEEGWIENLWRNEYAKAYPFLKEHHPDFPTPEYLLSITKYGNIAFEGDVREETEGSKMIKDAILDDDQRLLYLQSWGGANTIVRALMSIADQYQDTDQWEQIYAKVCGKVRILGIMNDVGQDNSFADYARPLFPDLVTLRTDFMYGGFMASVTTHADCIEMFQSDWLKENIKFGHGPLMSKYGLFGDGTIFEGEPDIFQYGQVLSLNWGFDAIPNIEFNPYDFLGEGDSGTYVLLFDVGLRGLENGQYGTLLGRVYESGQEPLKGYNFYAGEQGLPNIFLKGYQEEWAARADWCTKSYSECVHPPVVTVEQELVVASPGEAVELIGTATDPDGKKLSKYWFVYRDGSSYKGEANDLRVWEPTSLSTHFTIPSDAKEGDWFNILLQVTTDAESKITRYGQVIIQVTAKSEEGEHKAKKQNFLEGLYKKED